MSVAAQDFDYVRTLVRERAAIVLEDGKEYLVEARLGPVARREGLSGIAPLVEALRKHPPGRLHRAVVEALTTNETSFFRDWKPFEALRLHVLPAALQARSAERRLDVWSAACSSGQEVYSLAMLLHEHFPQTSTWTVRLHATDISGEMVERTRAGRFTTLEVNRGLPAPLLVKHFRRDGMEWVVKEELKRQVTTAELNLAQPFTGLPRFDVVMLRNVLIYFDVPTKKRILHQIRLALRPGGALFLGAAESTLNLCGGYERVEGAGTAWFRAV